MAQKFYQTLFYKMSEKGKSGIFKALIEEPGDHNYHIQFFDDLAAWGFKTEIIPIVIEGKAYDFCYHDSLEEAQKFLETMGYKINPTNPHEATWASKLFSVK